MSMTLIGFVVAIAIIVAVLVAGAFFLTTVLGKDDDQ
jgi:hypothetical protein